MGWEEHCSAALIIIIIIHGIIIVYNVIYAQWVLCQELIGRPYQVFNLVKPHAYTSHFMLVLTFQLNDENHFVTCVCVCVCVYVC